MRNLLCINVSHASSSVIDTVRFIVALDTGEGWIRVGGISCMTHRLGCEICSVYMCPMHPQSLHTGRRYGKYCSSVNGTVGLIVPLDTEGWIRLGGISCMTHRLGCEICSVYMFPMHPQSLHTGRRYGKYCSSVNGTVGLIVPLDTGEGWIRVCGISCKTNRLGCEICSVYMCPMHQQSLHNGRRYGKCYSVIGTGVLIVALNTEGWIRVGGISCMTLMRNLHTCVPCIQSLHTGRRYGKCCSVVATVGLIVALHTEKVGSMLVGFLA
ncbi:hypothetical protein CHS0354_025114 [Potamilus streckersoni]|uniref:Uncharacterized protein n=1 Tax=Potamilus streckersoni TaxID=2493646 RepID=A0AAE0SAL7_9BIVA|nr:hypothetical protein CHS0354_025114 [Potamilus streckersoni]